ncbi:NAD(P)/FAD-dependent oxidoreductase [Szabonella alba]|uniref:FAD-dependent oxidoreductase n=1 Tax=Szabonella alba TaxID=2804194 RepID=A0A8K0VGX2_9RHOB|nr:FAD-dependent oxidoreductase [Szabonella alba]MBL4919227.1 FAD-dependent oxidoreductase [Szabonella alba]
MKQVVIVGAGQAGATAAARLRALGFGGAVTLIGQETTLPYQRPPLSKKYLLGEMDLERLHLRPGKFYAEAGIDLRRGIAVQAIDRARCRVVTTMGDLPYDALILTTGARARPLPETLGADPARVHVVRTLADVDRMAPEFGAGRRVLIVGGGYIGLEAAAVAVRLGLQVTLVEMSARILQRVAAPETSDYFRALHRDRGVEILEATGLQSLAGGKAVLTDGQVRSYDFIIAGIGILPNDGLAAAAGLDCDGGVLVNARGQSSDPAIWAAGDCARFSFRGQMLRLESVQNAIDQAEAVAANLMGAAQDYRPKPWFWSDQYETKLQIAGLNTGYDRVVVRHGAQPGTSAHWYYRGEELLAVDAINEPRCYMVAKRLIDAGRSPAPERVADPGVELKALL